MPNRLPRFRADWVQLFPLTLGLFGAVFFLLTTAFCIAFEAGFGLGLRGLGQAMALGLSQIFVLFGCAYLFISAVSRPLRAIEKSAANMAGGELQRPVAQSPTASDMAAATAELRGLQRAWEKMRRALITKLRSSTELNLQLESEVARRSAELSRRNDELSEALRSLHETRDELLRTEKLAAVGRIAASVTRAIHAPVTSLATLPKPLGAALIELEQLVSEASLATRSNADLRAQIAALLVKMDEKLAELLRDGLRARDIVRAMRIYARPRDRQADGAALAEPDVLLPDVLLDDVLRLLSDPPLSPELTVAGREPYIETP